MHNLLDPLVRRNISRPSMGVWKNVPIWRKRRPSENKHVRERGGGAKYYEESSNIWTELERAGERVPSDPTADMSKSPTQLDILGNGPPPPLARLGDGNLRGAKKTGLPFARMSTRADRGFEKEPCLSKAFLKYLKELVRIRAHGVGGASL